jgi:hypothetical protein
VSESPPLTKAPGVDRARRLRPGDRDDLVKRHPARQFLGISPVRKVEYLRSPLGLQRLNETVLGAGVEVRVPVRALLGPVPELCQHRLDGLAARDRLATL